MSNSNTIITDKDVSIKILQNKKIGIIGYGNQGRAQALNLNDSNINVIIGLRSNSKSALIIENDGLEYKKIEDVVVDCDILSILIPDKSIANVWKNRILPNLKDNTTILFSHGYNVHYKLIDIPANINVIMVAPSGGGDLVRSEFEKGKGIPNLLAIYQDYTGESNELVKSYSKAIGGTRICAFFSTFQEETETDLFGEQAILTGGIPWLINNSFNVLIDKGYSPIVSWFVCYYELKTIVDLFHSKGFNYLFDSISDTAKYGGLTKGKLLMNEAFKSNLSLMLDDIRNGNFHKEISKTNKINENQHLFEDIEYYTQKLLKLLNKE